MRIWIGGSSAPLYQQVFDLLKSDIEQGAYPVDSQIPTELELSKMYGVGRVTVRRAIEELVGEGYLTKRQGRGTFVTATKIIRKVHQKDDVQSFTQACAENGMKAGAPVVARKIVAADRDLASFFGLDEGSDLILVSRVRTAEACRSCSRTTTILLTDSNFSKISVSPIVRYSRPWGSVRADIPVRPIPAG